MDREYVMVKGVIFDMDGLMFDTEPVWGENLKPATDALGLAYKPDSDTVRIPDGRWRPRRLFTRGTTRASTRMSFGMFQSIVEEHLRAPGWRRSPASMSSSRIWESKASRGGGVFFAGEPDRAEP